MLGTQLSDEGIFVLHKLSSLTDNYTIEELADASMTVDDVWSLAMKQFSKCMANTKTKTVDNAKDMRSLTSARMHGRPRLIF